MNFIDCLELFQKDRQTRGIVMVGEIGGSAGEEAAGSSSPTRSASRWSPTSPGLPRRQANAWGMPGAIISGGKGTADGKFAALEKAGVATVRSPAQIGARMAELPGLIGRQELASGLSPRSAEAAG